MSFSKDFLVTVINAIGIVIGVFLLNAYIARIHGIDVLGEYLLIRRTIFSAIGIFLIGMNIGLPFYIAKGKDNSYGKSAIISFIFITIPFLLLFTILIKLRVINLFFPELIWPIFIYAIGANILNLAIGLYRGHLNMLGASIISFIGSILIPVVFFLIYKDLSTILILIGSSVTLLSILVYFLREKNILSLNINFTEINNLLKYGFERIFSFSSQFFLLAGIPLLLYNEISKTSLAYLNSSISLIRLSLIIIGPIGFIILPRVSKMVANSSKDELETKIRIILSLIFFVGIIGMALMLFYGPVILKFWLGEISREGAIISRLIAFSIPLFMVTGILRSIIDSASERGYNSLIYSGSVIILLLVYFSLTVFGVSNLVAGIIGFNLGYIISGVLSMLFVKSILKIKLLNIELLITLVVQIAVLALVFIIINSTNMTQNFQFLLYLFILIIGSILFFYKSKQFWVMQIREKIISV
jgi:O-antigen/teichoic acid export membrane protein